MSGHTFKLRWHWYSDTEGEWEVTEAPRLGGLQDGTEMLLAPADEYEAQRLRACVRQLCEDLHNQTQFADELEGFRMAADLGLWQ